MSTPIRINFNGKTESTNAMLRRRFPTLDVVLADASIACGYRLFRKGQQKYWEKENIVGPAFVCMHSHSEDKVSYSFVILNQEG